METMTSRERFSRMYAHKEADRVPITDIPWQGTISRWQREGMPAGADWREYFGVDKVEGISDTPARWWRTTRGIRSSPAHGA